MHYASTSSDNVTDRAGNVLPGRQLSVYRTKDQTQPVTNLIQGGEPTTVLVTDINGEFVFEQPDDFPEPLWARTALGTWYRLVSDETQDQVGPMVAQFPAVQAMANQANQTANTAADDATAAMSRSIQALDTASAIANAGGILFDLAKTRPEFTVEFTGPITGLFMQCAVKASNGDWYVSVAAADGTYESVTIYHQAPNGDYIDSMKLHWAGHGTTIGLQEKPGGVYLWTSWSAATGHTSIFRTKYTPGATYDWTSPQVEEFSRFGMAYTIVAIDQANDRMAFRVGQNVAGQDGEFYQLRRLSDVESGTDEVLATVPFIPFSEGTAQGFCTIDDSLYRVVGSSSEQNRIERWDWATSTKLTDRNVDAINSVDGTNGVTSTHEPEGVTIFRDPLNGQVALMYGIVGGSATTGRRNTVYAFRQTANVYVDRQTRFTSRRPAPYTTGAGAGYDPIPLPSARRESGIPYDPTLKQFTILEDGMYSISVILTFVDPNTTGSRYISVTVGGTQICRVGGSAFAKFGSSPAQTLTVQQVWPCKRGDVVQATFYQSSGTTVDVSGPFSSVDITKIG